MITRRFQQQRFSLDGLPVTVPRRLRQTLERALAPVPAERFATAGEFALALAGSLAGPIARLGAAFARLASAVVRPCRPPAS